MRFLFLIALVVGVWLLIRSLRKPRLPKDEPKPPSPENEDMVACLQCGVHLPRSEALPGRDGVFCGEAHRIAHESGRKG